MSDFWSLFNGITSETQGDCDHISCRLTDDGGVQLQGDTSSFCTLRSSVITVFNMSTGATDVPAILWYCNLQRPTLCRLEEGVWQESGKTPISPTPIPGIITSSPWCCHCDWVLISCSPLAITEQPCSPAWRFSLDLCRGMGLYPDEGLVHDLNLPGNVKRCTNSCRTLIYDGR